MNPATQARVDRITRVCSSITASTRLDLERVVLIALKEQDRDTRHACAEAVAALNAHSDFAGPHEALSRAEQACMNARAV